MRRALLGAAALVLAACTSTAVWKSRSRAEGVDGRLYVPLTYAPVIPGSVYPNKKQPLPARGRPGVVVAVPDRLFARAARPLGERGLVVLRVAPGADLKAAAAWLAARPECAGARVGAELAGAAPAGADTGFAAVVAVAPPGLFTTPDVPTLVARTGGAEIPPPGVTVEKWYRTPEPFDARDLVPETAWRDTAEWLASELAR